MAKQIDVRITTTADLKGAQAVDQALAKLLQAQAKAIPKASGGDPFAPMAAGAQKAAIASQKLATETARTTSVTNQAAIAAQRLATEEQRTVAAVQNAAAAQTRAEQAALRLAQAQDQVGKGAAVLPRTLAGLSHEAASTATALLGVGSAIAVMGKGVELAQLGAQAGLVKTRFDGLAASANTTGDALLGALRKASGGEISDLNLQLAANRAQLLGVAHSAEEFGVLMAIARDRSQQLGTTTTEAFNDLVLGLGRGSKLILDNLGIMVDADAANKAYAASLGISASALDDNQRKQALINQVIHDGQASLAATGGAVAGAASSFAQLSAATDNAKIAVGGLLAKLLEVPAQVVTEVLVHVSSGLDQLVKADEQLQQFGATAVDTAHSFDEYGQKIDFINGELAPLGAQVGELTESQFNYAKALIASGMSAGAATEQAAKYGTAIQAAEKATTDWGVSSDALREQLVSLSQSSDGEQAAVNNLSAALLSGNINAETFRAAIAMLAVQHEVTRQAAFEEEREQRALAGAHYEGANAAFEAAAASMADTQAKELQTLQTQLLNEQAQITTNAFLAANPAINASGIQAMVTAGAISPLIGRLAELTLQIRQAKAELGGIAMGRPETGGDAIARSLGGAAASQRYLAEQGERAAAAQRAQVVATGTQAQKTKILKEDYDAAIRSFGKGSAEAINAQTKLLQAQRTAAGGGGGGGGGARAGGGGGAARVSAAEKTGSRLADIERTSGSRLTQIEEQTQSKLAAIDAKYAEQRARSMRELNDEIARQSTGAAFDQQIDDFDQFGKDMTDAQKQLFAARETAEVHYNERIAAAQDEARNEAVNGDADFAKDRLKIREDQAKRQQQIEERAAQANIDTGGKQTAAVAQQAAEATKANEDQANTEIAIAQAKSQEKGKAQADEKTAVLDAAETQRQDVIKKAQDTASAVKGASDDQKKTVVDNLARQAQAAKDWADAIVNASNTAQNAMGSVTGPPAATTSGEAPPGDTEAAGGGTFVTRGPTTLTVGDNPGGAELVHVVPLSGKGHTRVGAGMARMAGGGTLLAGGGDSPTIAGAISTFTDAAQIINILKPFVAANKGVLKLLNEYKSIVTAAVGSLVAIQDLRERMVMPSPALDPVVVLKLKDDVELVLNMMIAIDASAIKKIGVFAKFLTTEKSAIEILTQMQDLRDKLGTPTPPIDVPYIQALMADSKAVLDLLLGSFIPLKQHLVDDLKRYADTEGAAVQILSGVADLRKQLTEGSGTAFDIGLLRGLAKRAADITRMVQLQLVPVTEDQAAMFQRYADAAGAAVSILGDVADLRKQLTEGSGSPFDMNLLRGLAMRAAQILQIVRGYLIPTTEETAAELSAYADAAGSAVSILGGVADLRKQLSELTGGPFDMRVIQQLADEARRITQIVQAVLVPETEAEADGLSTYADSVGSAVGIVKDVAGLRKDAAELAAPVPEKAIVALAGEARRIAQIVTTTLIPTTEESATGLSRYAEAVSATVGVVSDVAGLRKDATDLAGPIPERAIIAVAGEAKRITQIVLARMVPASEEEAAAAQRFAETEGAAIQALKSVLEMPARLFADYQSPSNAQIDMVVKDANRIVQRVDQAARLYDTKGLDAAKAFSEAVGGTFTAFKDGLLFFEALNSGDFRLDPKNLAVFEKGMQQTMATAGRLGQQAVAIPAANITALQNVTAALTASYDSMIKLAAVPFGNVGQLAGQFGGGGGGGGQSIIVNINNPPAAMNVPATIQQVKQGIAQGIGAKR